MEETKSVKPIDKAIFGMVSESPGRYFAVGHSSQCFSFIRNWVEAKIRRHLAMARGRQGFGWKRWSRQYLYESLGLYGDYRVRYLRALPKASPAR